MSMYKIDIGRFQILTAHGCWIDERLLIANSQRAIQNSSTFDPFEQYMKHIVLNIKRFQILRGGSRQLIARWIENDKCDSWHTLHFLDSRVKLVALIPNTLKSSGI
jgi:hypothetical protein